MIEIKHFDEITIHELYSILRLRSSVFVIEQECIYQDIDNNDQNSIHFFIKSNTDIIAYLRVVQKEDRTSIGRVVVDNNHRKKSYAKALMNEAITYIYNTLHKNEIVISAQEYLIGFYQSLGFSSVGEGYLEDGIPHIRMIHSNK